MKSLLLCIVLGVFGSAAGAGIPITVESIAGVFNSRMGGCVFMDCSSNEAVRYNPAVTAERLTPCSTFKIWNTLLGLELKLIASPDEPFWTWDGEARSIADWNRDLSLKEALRVSCVPAFQGLARNIGPERMQAWIDTLGYGDRDISAGIDIFWLPRESKKSIQISPDEQAALIRNLLKGSLPVSEHSRTVLAEMLTVSTTPVGTLYGKTGTGPLLGVEPAVNIGWFVGSVQSGTRLISFACLLKGENVMGKDAKAIVETILTRNGLL